MLIIACLTFILSLFGASLEVLNNNVTDSNCLSTETDCGNGCCPFNNGTCCIETQTCCRQGAACLGPLPICIGLKLEDKSGKSLYSEQAVQMRDITSCPRGYTPCYGGCCPLSSAVCCSDKQTCCPRGYRCGRGYCWKSGKGEKKSLNDVHPQPYYEKKSVFETWPSSVKKGSEQSVTLKDVTKCSSGYFQCYDGCCEDGETCCHPFFGDYECCAVYEFCSPFGCSRG